MKAAMTLVTVTFMLNGAPVDLAPPVLYVEPAVELDPGLARQVLVPVREVFEKLGCEVTYEDTGHVRISCPYPRAEGSKTQVTFSPNEQRFMISANQLDLPVSPHMRSGRMYLPMIAVRVITGAVLCWDAQNRTVHCEYHPEQAPPTVTIAELMGDVVRWAHRRVQIIGEFAGYDGDPSFPATSHGPPEDCAWTLRDSTGAVYCSGADMVTPVHPLQSGQLLQLSGVLRFGYGGLPYLSQVEIRQVLAETE